MLANSMSEIRSGRLGDDVHLRSTAKIALLDFIANELPRWRDHPERPEELAEDRLTDHLCDYLNSAAYHSTAWDHIQFRTETGDEAQANRTIDLAAKPRTALIIEGRRHSIFDTLVPIECKRLPTPSGSKRDEREYVFNKYRSTGGIQRFKEGHHASNHNLAAMIAYVQMETCKFWERKVSNWIGDLRRSGEVGWTAADFLHVTRIDNVQKTVALQSRHGRRNGLTEIELRHFWIQMN